MQLTAVACAIQVGSSGSRTPKVPPIEPGQAGAGSPRDTWQNRVQAGSPFGDASLQSSFDTCTCRRCKCTAKEHRLPFDKPGASLNHQPLGNRGDWFRQDFESVSTFKYQKL